MSALAEAMQHLDAIAQEMVPDDLKAKGWRYVDPPTKFSHEMWDYFLALMGDGEYQVIIASAGTSKDGFKWKRGQFFVSPQGMKNLADKDRAAALTGNDSKGGAA